MPNLYTFDSETHELTCATTLRVVRLAPRIAENYSAVFQLAHSHADGTPPTIVDVEAVGGDSELLHDVLELRAAERYLRGD